MLDFQLQWPHRQSNKIQFCPHQQFKENFLLKGAVLPFRQLWKETQVRGHPVESVGTVGKDGDKWLVG